MSPEYRAAFATLPRNAVYIVLFNTGIGALLTAVGFGGTFVANLVYSQCIGLPAWLLCDLGRRLLWPGRPPPPLPMIALAAASLVLAWFGGKWLGDLVLGRPMRAENEATALLITAAASLIAVLYFRERENAARLERETAHEKGRAEAIERQIAQARLKLLQAQIEPHFLFNTLANLDALIPANPARAQAMLARLNDFLRAALAATRRERSTLADEFTLLRAYLEILAIRMGERLRFCLELPQALSAAALPPMLLQPLVENAIKHGIEPKIDGGEIIVRASADGTGLVLSVADTGLGLGGADTAGTGSGIAYVRERLSGAYGGAASLEMTDTADGGVTVTIHLPLER